MKITRICKEIRCDTVLCNEFAEFELSLGSYKGNFFMCEKCFKQLQNIFKRMNSKNG